MRMPALPRLVAVIGVGAALTLTAAACSDDSDDSSSTTTEAPSTTAADAAADTIVVIAQNEPDASTLVEFVVAAELAETLSGEGPFTVMAPTNDAFAAVPADTVESLKADPTGALADVLKLHVISGLVDSEAATAAVGTCVETLGGPVLVDQEADGSLTFGGAKILTVDVEGSNGIIHFIDGVVTAASTDCPAG